MATPPSAITSRFHRRERGDQRVGEILSDSNSELSSIDDDDGNDATAPRRVSEISDDDDRVTTTTQRDTKVHQRPAPVQTIKRKNSKWYDSDDDDWERPRVERSKPATSEAHSEPPRPPSTNDTEVKPPATKSVLSPDGAAAPASKAVAENGGKRSSFQRLVDITFNRSPFAAKRKGLDITSPTSSGPDTPRGDASKAPTTDAVARMRSPVSDGVSSVGDPPPVTTERRMTAGAVAANRKMSTDPNADLQSGDVISPQSNRQAVEMSSATRRRSNQVQSPGGVDPYTGSSELVSRRGSEIPTGVGDALSPGQRKVPGAFPGRPGSGVLLEGWLRQKQRRGVKGMKKWNSRYFVLYAKTNEVRYYADVVQSAWGPIPLGEMGSISLRLIQRIGKPGTLKYKGCRLDITCRNSWGTHYADDYVSSDEENNNNNEGDGGARNRSTDKSNSTPKSSRVYSLMADSPQTTQAWFSMLDSLLVRSANSPRVDVAPSSSSSASSKQLKRANSVAGGGSSGGATKMMTRRRSNTLDAETLVMANPTDNVPKPVLYAINFIFDSTPGIETDRFYTTEPDNQRLKSALKFLNQFATDSTRKPAKDELEATLDALTAGAIVKTWLRQLEQPIVPFEMYEDFHELALEATTAPFELLRNLKALVRALPRRHLAMMACLLFHLNDVSAYASKNGMDACVLASIFGEFILRPRTHNNNEDDAEAMRSIVEKMITHVDAIIDEKETDLLEHM